MVSSQGVEPVFAKIQAIRQWPSPKSFKALRSFLGLAGFYRCFIQGYASITTPLTTLLTCKNFDWPPSTQLAFDQLKIAVSSDPVLRLPDFSILFVLEMDASGIGMGVVLTQKGHPIAFFSKAFSPKLLQASTYVRELATITVAVKKWRQYLLGHHFTILTNHRSLKELMTQVIQTPEQHVYLARLIGYDYSIQFRSGNTNVVDGALSRINNTQTGTCLLLSMPNFVFLEDLKRELANYPTFLELQQNLRKHLENYPDHTMA